MKRHLLLLSAVLLLATPVLAQSPTIGVYFDEDATDLYGFTFTYQPITAYILVDDFENMLSGAAFSVDMDPGIYSAGYIAPDETYIAIGNLASGIEIGMDTPLPVFGGAVGLLGTIQMYSDHNLYNTPISVGAHPNYATPVVANSDALEFEATGVTSYLKANAQPEVCVYFDTEATMTDMAYAEGMLFPVYVVVRDAEMMVSGAAFKLDALDPAFDVFGDNAGTPAIEGVSYANGIVQGNLFDGVEIGLYTPVAVFEDEFLVLASMVLSVSDNETPHGAEFEIVAHPNYDDILISDSDAYTYVATTCGISTVDLPVPNEDMDWGSVKTLFK